MILDAHNLEPNARLASPPTAGVSFGGALLGSGLDLNPDYGTGQQARRSPYPGGGEPWYLHVKITGEFVIANGTPLVQFHAMLSTTGAYPALLHSGSYISVGMNAAPYRTVGGRQMNGYLTSEIPVNTQLYVPIVPWSDVMGRDQVSAVLDPKTLRYIGLGIVVPNGDVGGNTGYTVGLAEWHLVKHSDISQDPETLTYPSGRTMVG